MENQLAPCYLVDGHGMEVLLRRLGGSSASRAGGPWKILNEQRALSGAATIELCVFGLPAKHPAGSVDTANGLMVRVQQESISEFVAWVKRDARRRTSPCRYCLVSDNPESRVEARQLGIAVLEEAGLVRRLGLLGGSRHLSVEKTSTPRDPAIRKAGTEMSETELRWWSEQLDARGEENKADDPVPGSAQDALLRDPDDPAAEFARRMGTDLSDPRILDHEDEDWMDENFPDKNQ